MSTQTGSHGATYAVLALGACAGSCFVFAASLGDNLGDPVHHLVACAVIAALAAAATLVLGRRAHDPANVAAVVVGLVGAVVLQLLFVLAVAMATGP